jgi:hypothetical protein
MRPKDFSVHEDSYCTAKEGWNAQTDQEKETRHGKP